MPELTASEKLYPSLLDRLRDDDPGSRSESRDRRVINMQQLRNYVRRDLAWLLNAVHFAADHDLQDVPEVQRSVVNFGVPGLAGSSVDRNNLRDLELEIQEAIAFFEPRIQERSLRVRITLDNEAMNRNAMVFEINGELWGDPVPSALYLKTEVDLETGAVTVMDQ